MGSSPDEDDVERVDTDYVDPNSTSRGEIEDDLKDEGIEGDSLDAFVDRIVEEGTVEQLGRERAEQRGNQITRREDVDDALDRSGLARNEGRDDALVESASQRIGAPTESELQRARSEVAQRVDESGTVRSDPSLDPLGGEEGREIGTVSEITQATGGRGGGMREGIEPTGSGRGTYYFEDDSGNRYPVAEVNL